MFRIELGFSPPVLVTCITTCTYSPIETLDLQARMYSLSWQLDSGKYNITLTIKIYTTLYWDTSNSGEVLMREISDFK